MRVALIAPPWVAVPPAGYGGTETVLDGLARGLAAAGHDVLLFTTGDSTCPVPRAWTFEQAIGVGSGGAASELRHVVHAYEAVRDYDVVHDHTLVGPVYCDRFRDLNVVTTNHGPFASDLGDFYRAISSGVPVIAISQHHASTARDIRLAAVIHHGIDVTSVPVGSGDGGYAVFLGRMSPDKGVHAAARIARASGIPLQIAAKMSEQIEHDYFRDRVKPLLGGDVEYVGEVGGAGKYELLGGATCLINPIAWPEPFGMVMIEALAAGTPVLATPQGAAPEIVDDGVTGYLRTDEESAVAAVAKIADLNRNDCRRAAEERFSLERMVQAHVSCYERLAAAHSGPAPVARRTG